MPRMLGSTGTTKGRRRRKPRTDTTSIVATISQLVSATQTLKHENANLLAQNEQLRAQLLEIGSALGRLSGGPRRGRARAVVIPGTVEAKPKRTRRPITDPEVLARRNAALAKARAARAEKLAAAKAKGSNGASMPGEG